MTGATFDCEIQARFRDMNIGGHVDNVEAMRVVDEARIEFFRFARVFGEETPGLLRASPSGVTDLMGSQRIEYRTEMRFAPYKPFLVRLWVSHIGRTSFTVAAELKVAADHPPALLAESTLVLWDTASESAWPISGALRTDLETFLGEPVALRGR